MLHHSGKIAETNIDELDVLLDDLRTRGAVFVEELDEVPDGSTVIFSAHGVSKAVREEADRRGLKVFGPASGSQACGDVGMGRMLEATDLALCAAESWVRWWTDVGAS